MTIKSGLLLIDKTGDFTSHDVVAKVRGILKTRKVGHAGTLDPMATGLLILGVNSATKLLTFLVGEDKTYLATIRLGAATITDDAEGEQTSQATTEQLAQVSVAKIDEEISKLTGQIMQVPSSVSAIKVNGERSYAKVRAGEEVKLSARPITVSKFQRLSEPSLTEGYIDLEVEIDCSSGTYIRALARDLGNALSVGGHLTVLRRTRIGKYSVDQALSLEQLQKQADAAIFDISEAARQQFESFELSDQQEVDLRHGKRIRAGSGVAKLLAGFNRNGQLVAMLEPVASELKSVVVFAGEAKDD